MLENIWGPGTTTRGHVGLMLRDTLLIQNLFFDNCTMDEATSKGYYAIRNLVMIMMTQLDKDNRLSQLSVLQINYILAGEGGLSRQPRSRFHKQIDKF